MIYSEDQTIGAYQNEVAESLRALASRLQALEAAVEQNQQELDHLNWRLKDIETRLDELAHADQSDWGARRIEIDTSTNQLSQDLENTLTLLGG